MSIALLALLLAALQTGPNTMEADVDRLVKAAEQLTGSWPSQPPPAIPEVTVVARHGRAAVPSLIALLSDDPDAEQHPSRWKVQQQIALTLSRIYSESDHCGRSYCDGDPPERIGRVKAKWLRLIAADRETTALTGRELVDRFKAEKEFSQQLEIARALADTSDGRAIAELAPWLTHDDRHVRGNAAFVLARLGDPRGFVTLAAILADHGPRPSGQGTHGPRWRVEAQIRADRYYAAHLLGDLKDPRGVDLLVPLLDDRDVEAIVPWSLGEIGDARAIAPLVASTERDDPSAHVLAISALERLNAPEALPRLRELLQDTRKSTFGNGTTVAEAARRAIAVISQVR